jgi:hypothetical protein
MTAPCTRSGSATGAPPASAGLVAVAGRTVDGRLAASVGQRQAKQTTETSSPLEFNPLTNRTVLIDKIEPPALCLL